MDKRETAADIIEYRGPANGVAVLRSLLEAEGIKSTPDRSRSSTIERRSGEFSQLAVAGAQVVAVLILRYGDAFVKSGAGGGKESDRSTRGSVGWEGQCGV